MSTAFELIEVSIANPVNGAFNSSPQFQRASGCLSNCHFFNGLVVNPSEVTAANRDLRSNHHYLLAKP